MNISITGFGCVLPRADERALPDFKLADYPVSPKTYLDRASALALAASSLALQNAGLVAPFDEEFGLSLGTRFGCVETMRTFESALSEKGARGASPLLFSHSYFNSPAAILAIEWGLQGIHVPLCGPNAGWQALETARDALELGHATRMLCGAVEALSPARGFVDESDAGEGALFWVLERDSENGKNWDDVFGEAREISGDWGALGELLARMKT